MSSSRYGPLWKAMALFSEDERGMFCLPSDTAETRMAVVLDCRSQEDISHSAFRPIIAADQTERDSFLRRQNFLDLLRQNFFLADKGAEKQ
jgi:hypothetical protein